jgi:hypothetical protein
MHTATTTSIAATKALLAFRGMTQHCRRCGLRRFFERASDRGVARALDEAAVSPIFDGETEAKLQQGCGTWRSHQPPICSSKMRSLLPSRNPRIRKPQFLDPSSWWSRHCDLGVPLLISRSTPNGASSIHSSDGRPRPPQQGDAEDESSLASRARPYRRQARFGA